MTCPTDLRRLYSGRRVIPFIGAGASMAVCWGPDHKQRGPAWEEMVDQAAKLLGASEPNLLRCRGTDLQILEYFKILNGGFAPLTNWLSLQFSAATNDDILASPIHAELVKLDRCSIYYTTNYDNFLERALGKSGRSTHITSSELNIGHDRTFVEVVKFHGDFNTPDQMVLSESQYMDRMRLESPMDFKLRADILGRAVLFIGYSFRDPNVNYIFHIVRTERGRFTLRSKLFDASRPSDEMQTNHTPLAYEYVAERRALGIPREEVLCASEGAFGHVLTFQGIDTDAAPILSRLLSDENVSYVPRSEAEIRNDAKQFVTYVLVQCGQRLLFFKRSYLSRAAEFLRGSKCIGFGGHVSAADADILSLDDRGLSACTRRELIEELHLPSFEGEQSRKRTIELSPNSTALPRIPNRATIRLFQNVPLERLGVLNDYSSEVGRRHVAVIYRAWLSDWNSFRHLQKGDSSIKGPASSIHRR
jgi:predicted NUDIX family phosphoesterase